MDNSFIQIGQLGKSFGTDGFNRIKIFDEFLEVAKTAEFLFLEEEDYHVPFRVISWKKGNAMIQFDDVKTQDQADQIQSKRIYLSSDKVAHLQVTNLVGLEGFIVFDQEIEVGPILYLHEMPHQLLATVDYKGKEIFIPIVEELVEKIDTENQQIRMNLPEGILELE